MHGTPIACACWQLYLGQCKSMHMLRAPQILCVLWGTRLHMKICMVSKCGSRGQGIIWTFAGLSMPAVMISACDACAVVRTLVPQYNKGPKVSSCLEQANAAPDISAEVSPIDPAAFT